MVALPVALLLGSGLGWAGRVLLAPPTAPASEAAFTLVTVSNDSVGRSFSLNASASWRAASTTSTSRGQDSGSADSPPPTEGHGVVTHIWLKGATTVEPGDPLYAVNLAPVVAAEGAVPSFRDLQIGSTGADVRQVQELLRAAGHRTSEATGVYDRATANEVYAWKKAHDIPPDGVFEAVRVVFIPKLPARVALVDAVSVGAPAPAGASGVRVLPNEPSFSIMLPAGQAQQVRTGQQVSLSIEGAQWEATIGELGAPSEEGEVRAILAPAKSEETICAKECDLIPLSGASGIDAQIVIVPRASGPVVPTAALRLPDGARTEVVDEAGKAIPVTIKASAGGLAVVDGVDIGTRVRVPQEKQ